MLGETSPHKLQNIEASDIGVHERDAAWSSAIIDGIAADIEIFNNSADMLPDEIAAASSRTATGQASQYAMYDAYKDLPERVLCRMVERKDFPADALDEDALGAATLGLFEAMRGWDGSRNQNFRTFASAVIKSSVITQYADMSEVSGLPKLHHERRAIVESIDSANPEEVDAIFERLGLNPFLYVPVLPKGLDPSWVEDYSAPEYLELLDLFRRSGRIELSDAVSVADVIDDALEQGSLMNNKRPPQSFDLDTSATAAIQTLLRMDVSDILAGLPERDRQVLRLRFGLDDGQVKTLEEVSKSFPGTTRERIRQIEAKALAKLRNPTYDHRARLIAYIYED